MRKRNRAKSRRPEKREKIDWNEAFVYYCTSKEDMTLPSYNDVALKFGVATQTVDRVGKRDEWVKKRADAGKRLLEEFENNREELAKELNQRQFKNLEEMETVLMQNIKDMRKSQLTLLRPNMTIEEKIVALKHLKDQPFAIEKLSNAIKNINNLQRIILGLATEISKQDINQKTEVVTLSPKDIEEMDAFNKKNAPVKS